MATTTTTTTTSLETTMTMTLTVIRSAETNRRLVAIAQISDSIGDTIVSLHQLQQYARRHGQASSVSSTSSVSRLTSTLSSIRTSLEKIRGYLMDDDTVVCGQFNRDLDVCAMTGRTLAGKLGPIVSASAPPPPPQMRLGNVTIVSAGNDNDGESEWESIKGGRRSGDEKPVTRQFSLDMDVGERDGGGVLARFQPFADHLLTGLQVLLKARSCTSSSDQELLLDNYTSREAIREVGQDQLHLMAKFNRDGTPSYGTRLKQRLSNLGSILLPTPSKVTSLLKGPQPELEPCSEKPTRRQSLPRANTWPLLKQLDKKSWSNERAAAREAREARKRSQLIDKQIEADLCNLNKKCLILTNGSRSSMSLLMSQFMTKSRHYSHSTSAMDATQSRKCVNAIRQHVLSEVNCMIQSAISIDAHIAHLLDNPRPLTMDGLKPFWTEDELKPLFSLQRRMSKEHAVLEEFVGPLEKLWSWGKFREACKGEVGFTRGRLEAHNIFLMETLRRVSAPDYVPTPADYHCYSLLQGNRASRGTYDFDVLSVSWVDFSGVCCCSPLLPKREKRTAIFHDATTYVHFVDLATYCMAQSDDGAQNVLVSELSCIETYDSSKNYYPHMSVAIVFSNVKLFRERLAKIPLSRKWFPDYTGQDGNEAQTISFLVDLFGSKFTRRRVYTHVGEPEDPETTNFILDAVKDTKLNSVLSDAGVIRGGRR